MESCCDAAKCLAPTAVDMLPWYDDDEDDAAAADTTVAGVGDVVAVLMIARTCLRHRRHWSSTAIKDP